MALLGVLACFLFMVTVWVIPLFGIHFIGSGHGASHLSKERDRSNCCSWSKGRAQLDSDSIARIVDVSGSEGRDHSLRISTYMFKL